MFYACERRGLSKLAKAVVQLAAKINSSCMRVEAKRASGLRKPLPACCLMCRFIGDPTPVATCTKPAENKTVAEWVVDVPDGCKDRELLRAQCVIAALLMFACPSLRAYAW